MKNQDKKTKIGIVALSIVTVTLSVGLVAKLTKSQLIFHQLTLK